MESSHKRVSLHESIVIVALLIALLASIITTTSANVHRPRNQRSPPAVAERLTARSPNEPNADEDPPTSSSITPDDEPPPTLCGLPLLRLPKRIVPSHYDLMMMPNLSSLIFEGVVQIDLEIRKLSSLGPLADNELASNTEELGESEEDKLVEANQIVLHADDSLVVENIWFRDLAHRKEEDSIRNKSSASRNEYIDVVNVCREPEYQLIVITLARELKPNTRGQLYMTFAGPLSENMRGLYRSPYTNSTHPSAAGSGIKYLATTQLQATEARRVFPCFDEPAFKATFDVSLVHQAQLESHGNMEKVYQRLLPNKYLLAHSGDEQKLVKFSRTPRMSTYLVAFVVGQFDRIERKLATRSGQSMTISVHSPPGRSYHGAFALDTASRAYPLLEEYCSIELPLTRKLDLVAISDFEAGAMENWGLITFKDQQLLVDPEYTSPISKALIGATVVHELAHHWFGNLVTMGWWNDIWLNEGFATWFEQHTMVQLYPELEYQFHYLLESHIYALNHDSFRHSHPVRPEAASVTDPQDIDDLFDAISYNKAAAIIRTLHDDYMKPEPFRSALREYLSGRKLSTATAEDLWHYMDSSSGGSLVGRATTTGGTLPTVRQYMESWLDQPGHPLISVQLNSSQAGKPPSLRLEQSRFMTNVDILSEEESQQRWIILVNALVSDGKRRQQVLQATMRDDSLNGTYCLELPDWFDSRPNSGHWIKLNANFSGFYRTLYPLDLFKRLEASVRRRILPTADRLNLLDETHTLVMGNKVGPERLIELLSWLVDENHGAVLESAATAYLALLKLFDNGFNSEPGRGLHRKLLQFGQNLFGSMYGRQLPDNYHPNKTSHMLELGRSAVYKVLVRVGHELTLTEALRTFDVDELPAPPPHLRSSYYTAVARNGSEAQHRRLMNKLNTLESREELTRLAGAMTRAEQQDRLEKFWSWLQGNSTNAADLDHLDIISSMVQAGPVGRDFVRQLLEKYPDKLVEMNKGQPVTSLIEELYIASGLEPTTTELNGLFVKQRNLMDWTSSRDYIKRTLSWQSRLRTSGAKQLAQAIDHYLGSRVRPKREEEATTTATRTIA